MCRTRWLKLVACGVSSILTGALLLVLVTPAEKVIIAEASLAKCELGMDEAQISSLLGLPAGDYRTTDRIAYSTMNIGLDAPLEYSYVRSWKTDERTVDVYFSKDGRAVHILVCMGTPEPQWYDKMYHWAKRQF
jgi:hypothetical protein